MYRKVLRLFQAAPPTPDEALETLVAQCVAGNDKSREWFYKKFYGYLMAVTIRYTKDQPCVEELVNDSFVKIFRNLHLFTFPEDTRDQLSSLKGWIAKIASRTTIDYLRIEKNSIIRESLDDQLLLASSEDLTEKINVQSLLALLDSLPDIQRIIFNLFEIEGYSHEEIASYLNIPVKNSRVYLSRAKNRLQQRYLQTSNRCTNE